MRAARLAALTRCALTDGVRFRAHRACRASHGVPRYGSLRRFCETPAGLRAGYRATGCSLAAKAPALGAGDRWFESNHPEKFFMLIRRVAPKCRTERFPEGGGILRERKPLQHGIDAEAIKKWHLTPHSMRHSFVSLSRTTGLSDFAVMALWSISPGTCSNDMEARDKQAGIGGTALIWAA